RVVELCEASARLADEGCIRLPPADPHSLAWHRFFPRGTRWTDPSPVPRGRFLEVLRETTCDVRGIPAQRCAVSGRWLIRLDDYAAWRERLVPEQVLGAREDGIDVARWNAWIRENSDDERVNLYGPFVSTIETAWALREGERIEEYAEGESAEEALDERLRGIDQLCLAGLTMVARSGEGPILSESQQDI